MMQDYWVKLKSFIMECKRVLIVTKKPNREEFKAVVKVSGIGMIIIGFIGFLIFIIGDLIR
ncbi:MAG: protein translocase SEC61 complex subunit gamma [Nanoarchaeota archaeon]|nr:protein translocase SEC61 complex subunit gamma [Nanoarchaeota archaeon]